MKTTRSRVGRGTVHRDDVAAEASASSANGASVLERTIEATRRADRGAEVPTIPGIALGELVGVGGGEGARVDYAGNPAGRPLPAVSTVALSEADVGRSVALGFADGDAARPIVLGFLWQPAGESGAAPAEAPAAVEVERDGERLVLTAEREITLRCGRASVTLTRAGKVLVRGTYLLSRSSGVNRIKGGSVQIN